MKTVVPVSVVAIAVLLYFTGVVIDNHLLRLIAKPFPLIAFLFMLKPDTRYRKYIFAGLVLSLIGDILLEVSPGWFLYGLVSFLSAHIAYIFAFTGRSRKAGYVPLILLSVFGIAVFYVLYPGLNDMMLPVLFYLTVILIMAWRAVVQRNFDKYSMYAAAGALFFVFSDGVIAVDKFYTAVPYARWIIMITYWTAQSLIFYSAYKSDR
jgi:uncharacterized membrane protein YhhN